MFEEVPVLSGTGMMWPFEGKNETFLAIRGPPFNLQGVEGLEFLYRTNFLSTRLGGALKISNLITCLYRRLFEVNIYFTHSLPEIIYLKKTPASPPLGD